MQAYADNGRTVMPASCRKGPRMCNLNEWIVREAFRAYERGDIDRLMGYVDAELEWTYLESGPEDRKPLTRHGREELEQALRLRADQNLRSELEQVIANGEKVMLVMRTPGISRYRPWHDDDRTYDVVTVRDQLIVGLQACCDRSEARSLAGIV
jgi:ketosteroid isomerase-like protein